MGRFLDAAKRYSGVDIPDVLPDEKTDDVALVKDQPEGRFLKAAKRYIAANPPRIQQPALPGFDPVIPLPQAAAPQAIQPQAPVRPPVVTPAQPPTVERPQNYEVINRFLNQDMVGGPELEPPREKDRSFAGAFEFGLDRTIRDTRRFVADVFQDGGYWAKSRGGTSPEFKQGIQRIRDSADEMDRKIQAKGYEPMTTDEIAEYESLVDGIYNYATSVIGTSAAPMLGSIITGGTGSPLFLSAELNASLKEIKGLSREDRLRYATMGGVMGGVLENLGLGILLKGIPKGAIGKMGAKRLVKYINAADSVAAARVGKALIEGGVGEGLTELAQEGIFIDFEGLAGKEFQPGEVIKRLTEAGIGGGPAGVTLRGTPKIAAEAAQVPGKISRELDRRFDPESGQIVSPDQIFKDAALDQATRVTLPKFQAEPPAAPEVTLPKTEDPDAPTAPEIKLQSSPDVKPPEVEREEVPIPAGDPQKPEARAEETEVKPVPVEEPSDPERFVPKTDWQFEVNIGQFGFEERRDKSSKGLEVDVITGNWETRRGHGKHEFQKIEPGLNQKILIKDHPTKGRSIELSTIRKGGKSSKQNFDNYAALFDFLSKEKKVDEQFAPPSEPKTWQDQLVEDDARDEIEPAPPVEPEAKEPGPVKPPQEKTKEEKQQDEWNMEDYGTTDPEEINKKREEDRKKRAEFDKKYEDYSDDVADSEQIREDDDTTVEPQAPAKPPKFDTEPDGGAEFNKSVDLAKSYGFRLISKYPKNANRRLSKMSSGKFRIQHGFEVKGNPMGTKIVRLEERMEPNEDGTAGELLQRGYYMLNENYDPIGDLDEYQSLEEAIQDVRDRDDIPLPGEDSDRGRDWADSFADMEDAAPKQKKKKAAADDDVYKTKDNLEYTVEDRFKDQFPDPPKDIDGTREAIKLPQDLQTKLDFEYAETDDGKYLFGYTFTLGKYDSRPQDPSQVRSFKRLTVNKSGQFKPFVVDSIAEGKRMAIKAAISTANQHSKTENYWDEDRKETRTRETGTGLSKRVIARLEQELKKIDRIERESPTTKTKTEPAAAPGPSIRLKEAQDFGEEAIKKLLGVSGKSQRKNFFRKYAKDNNLDPALIEKLGEFILEDRDRSDISNLEYPYEPSPGVSDYDHFNNQLMRVIAGDEKLLQHFNILPVGTKKKTRKKPKALRSEAPNATQTKPASRESLESVPAVSPGKAKPRANTRGIKAGDLITKLTLNDASSIYREAFRVAGKDPEIMVNRPIGEQFDVLEKMMKDEFGFKFIQRSKDDPQGAVNALLDAYRSLSFMTYTLGLPKEAIGLQGELGLALPGKDWGRYFAAYYPRSLFPVQTKSDLPPMKSPFIIMPKRPNSFAHEYGHALDFFLMDKLGNDAAAGLTQVIRQAERFESPMRMETPANLQQAMGQLMGALFFDEASQASKIMKKEQQLSKQIAAYEKRLEKDPTLDEPKSLSETREDLVRLRSGASRSPKESVYRRTSTDFAKKVGSDPNYWREPTEMFARAFEAYVAHIVTQAGGTTKFTALPDAAYKMTLQEVEGYDIRLPMTHPQESERNRVFLAFNNLFDVLRETSLSDQPLFPGSRTEKPEGLDTVDITSEFKPIPEPQAGSKAATEKARKDINAAIRQTNREKQRPGRFDNLKAGPKYIENLYEYVFSRTLQSKRGSLLTLMKRYGDNPKAKAALEEIFSKVATDPGGKDRVTTKGGTFEEATNRELRRFSQVYRSITERHDMKSLSDFDRIKLRMTLTGRERNPPEHIKKLAADLRNKLLIPAFDYAKRKGVRIRYLQDGAYLPRIMDNALVFSNERKFLNKAYKLYKDVMFENDFGEPDTHNWDQLKDLKTLTRRKQFRTRLEGDENIEEFWSDVEKLKRLEKLLDNEDGSVAEKAEDDIAELEAKIDEYYEEVYELINETYADINSRDWLFRIHQMSGMDPAAHPPMGRFTKKRTLPSEADEIMDEFYLDVEDSLLSYIPAVVRKAEYEQRFGGSLVPKGKKKDPDNNRRDYLDYILDEKMAGEIDPDDRQHIRYMVRIITGTQGPVADIPFQKFGNWVHALGTMSLLGRAAWSAIAEPLTAGIQAQSVRKGFKAFGLTLYEAYAMLPVDDAKQKVNLNKELANILGIISDPEVGELSANRLGGTFADDPKMAKRVNRFFSVTKLQGLTNAQRRSTMRIGFEFMKSLSNDFLDPQAKNAENRAKVKRRAKRLLNEFGINDDDMKQFTEFMRDGGQLPEVSDLVNDDGSLSDMGELTAVAVGRFVDQSIQDPKSVDRPKFAEHPLGRIIYGIQSFIYAFHRNVLTRAIKETKTIAQTEGKVDAAKHVAGTLFPTFLSLYLGHTLVAAVRAMLFDRDRLKDEIDDDNGLNYVLEMGVYRSGFTGTFDPWIQLFRSLKYNRDINTILIGAGPSYMLQAMQKIWEVMAKNSPNTVAAEYQALAGLYNISIVPLTVLAVSHPAFGRFLGPLQQFRGGIAGATAAFGTSSTAKHFVARNIIKGIYGVDYYPGKGGAKKQPGYEKGGLFGSGSTAKGLFEAGSSSKGLFD